MLAMTRKESEKDSERPHYYSQFWLDVAAGRRIIGTPKTNEEGDLEDEAPIIHHPMRNGSSAISDGYRETIAHPEVEPDLIDDVYAEPEFEDADIEEAEEAEEAEELEPEEVEIPALIVDDAEIPDMDLAPLEEEALEEEEEEEFFDEDEEEDEDDGWSGARGRKKPKPGRQAKLPPKPPAKKPTKRRGF